MATPMTSSADRRGLIAAAREGDSGALGALWARWNPAVLRYLRARGVSGPDDTASAIWLDVARGLSRFEGDEDQFRSWLFTIAHHRVVDEHRRRARMPTVELDGAGTPPSSAPGTRPCPDRGAACDGPEHTVLAAESLDRALRLCRLLPSDQAEVVALRVIADLDVATVASMLGKRPGTVRVLAHRGLARLAVLLSEPEAETFTCVGEMPAPTARSVTQGPGATMETLP